MQRLSVATRRGECSWAADFGTITKPMSDSPWLETNAMGGLPPSEPAFKAHLRGDRKAHPPAADPNNVSKTDLIRNQKLWML
jgi:hypothetical protein